VLEMDQDGPCSILAGLSMTCCRGAPSRVCPDAHYAISIQLILLRASVSRSQTLHRTRFRLPLVPAQQLKRWIRRHPIPGIASTACQTTEENRGAGGFGQSGYRERSSWKPIAGLVNSWRPSWTSRAEPKSMTYWRAESTCRACAVSGS
jgi:hypothetical protein